MNNIIAKRYDKYVAHFPSAMSEVDECLIKVIGVGRNGLADISYRAMWEDGLTPLEIAQAALSNEFGSRAPDLAKAMRDKGC
jgi:hypothetical protein